MDLLRKPPVRMDRQPEVMSVLLTESKDIQWPVQGTEKVRLEPTVAAILDAARPTSQGKGEFLRLSALKIALIGDILAERFPAVYGTLGKLLRRDLPAGTSLPTWEVGCPQCGLHLLAEPRRNPR
jgi:hypothetical protein